MFGFSYQFLYERKAKEEGFGMVAKPRSVCQQGGQNIN